MRKLLWGGGAAAVAVLIGGTMTVQYAVDCPSSLIGRCFALVLDDGTTEVRATHAVRHTAEEPLRTETTPDKQDGAAHDAPAPEDVCAVPPAVLPGGVAMHEDPDLPAQPLPPVRDIVGALPFLGGVDDPEDARMRPVEDEAPKMPRVPGDDDDERPATGVNTARPRKAAPGFPKMGHDGTATPRHPEVNTLEIRPSDLRGFPLTPF